MSDEIQQGRSQPPRDEDDYDDAPRARRGDLDDPDRFRRPQADVTGGLIPYKNPKALIAYYCGVFSLIPCVSIVLGPAALILGILGMRYQKQHPTAGGLGHAIAGVVLGSITTLASLAFVAMFLVGFIAAIAKSK
jgi:Domain of unknown function (DUF4190)